ncbi:MAG: cupin domain-containing protein [Proteobacteria bacterium]|nr:cupin domain-containing protein [Pseudomonadota bacterium]
MSINIASLPTAKLHKHKEAQLSYIQKGVLKVIVRQSVYIVPAGFAIYIPSEVTHGIEGGKILRGYCYTLIRKNLSYYVKISIF